MEICICGNPATSLWKRRQAFALGIPPFAKSAKGGPPRPGYDSSVDQQCFPDLRVGRSIIKTGPIALFSRIAQPRLTLWLAIAGALSFWLADLAIHVAASLDSTPARWDAAFVFLPPGTFLFAYLIARRVAARRGVKRVGVAMLVGVLLASGTFMAITATATARGICPYQCSGLAGHDIAVDNPDGDVLLRSVGRQPVRIACLDVSGRFLSGELGLARQSTSSHRRSR